MGPKTQEDGEHQELVSPPDDASEFSSPRDRRYHELFKGYHIEAAKDLFHIDQDQYATDKDAKIRGTANPTLMEKPFWKYMTLERIAAWDARAAFEEEEDPEKPHNNLDPVWCFRRFGATHTKLPDGRIISIGGEHEDYYDVDFCIYNVADVVVITPPQSDEPHPPLTPDAIKIYGYPLSVFPPTDFHTSTYFRDAFTEKEYIIIIGGLGYPDSATRNTTEVYQLDLGDFTIQRLETSGKGPPGGTAEHTAELVDAQEAARSDMIVVTTKAGKDFVLRIRDWAWMDPC